MGNFWIPQFDSSSSSSPSSTGSSPGNAQNASNEGTHSGTRSAFLSRSDEVFPNGRGSPVSSKQGIPVWKNQGLHARGQMGPPSPFPLPPPSLSLSSSSAPLPPPLVDTPGSPEQGILPNGQILSTPNSRIFTFAELKAATGNFRPDTVIGKGRFGTVFKGWIDKTTFAPTEEGSGMAIAVKKLNSDDFHGMKEWQSEVNNLRSLSHPNIVRLLGHCEEDKELLLVYEFMPRGSLGNRLSGGCSAFESFSWSIRLKIAIGAARGLAFLHHKKGKIIYRSLKPFDILLDSCYNAKISDFGLVRNGPPHGENSHVSTCVMGAYGYAAPEYVVTGHLYEKSDVYSFGVVLLEMLLGMPALYANNCLSGQQNLVNWAKLHLSDRRKVSQMMDRQLEGQYSSQGADLAAQLILRCLSPYPRNRPSMTKVVAVLKQIQAFGTEVSGHEA